MNSFDATLKRWGFRPINSNGQPIETTPAPQPKEDEEARKIAQKILETPDVQI